MRTKISNSTLALFLASSSFGFLALSSFNQTNYVDQSHSFGTQATPENLIDFLVYQLSQISTPLTSEKNKIACDPLKKENVHEEITESHQNRALYTFILSSRADCSYNTREFVVIKRGEANNVLSVAITVLKSAVERDHNALYMEINGKNITIMQGKENLREALKIAKQKQSQQATSQH